MVRKERQGNPPGARTERRVGNRRARAPITARTPTRISTCWATVRDNGCSSSEPWSLFVTALRARPMGACSSCPCRRRSSGGPGPAYPSADPGQPLFLPLSVLTSAGLASEGLHVPFLRSVLGTEPRGWTQATWRPRPTVGEETCDEGVASHRGSRRARRPACRKRAPEHTGCQAEGGPDGLGSALMARLHV